MFDFSDMKNAVIGNNKQKSNLIVLGAVPRYVSSHSYWLQVFLFLFFLFLIIEVITMHWFTACRLLYLLQQSSSSLELRTECSVVLGSLAMGTENNIKSLVDCQIIPSLLQGWTAHTKYCIKIIYNISEQISGMHKYTPLFCACRSSLPWPDIYWSLSSMSQNSLHKPSHSHAAALYCRLFYTCCVFCSHQQQIISTHYLSDKQFVSIFVFWVWNNIKFW